MPIYTHKEQRRWHLVRHGPLHLVRHVRNNDDDAALQHFRAASNRQFDSPDMTGKTVFEHALYKALQGEIDVRNCEEFDGFERFEILPTERP